MSSIAEIESAIEKLSAPDLDELADWLELFRLQRETLPEIETWLAQARGAALSGTTTAEVMKLTRGEA